MADDDASDFWIFGYGSLMWRPDFAFVERAKATITGYHRAFCIASTMHRGTPERPGLVLGLDRGRACTGVAYRISPTAGAAVMAYLRARELIYGVYRETRLVADLADGASQGQARVVAYTVERAHPSYTGVLSLGQQARIIRGAGGQSGANLDYLINTVRHLQALGIRERALERLLGVAAGHVAHSPGDGLSRPFAAGLRSVAQRRQSPVVRVPQGDQRRFGYRVRLDGAAHIGTP